MTKTSKATPDDIMAAVRGYLRQEFPDRSSEIDDLGNDAALFDLGLIDSLSFHGMVSFLEGTFDIKVPPEDYSPQLFGSLEAIAGYVAR